MSKFRDVLDELRSVLTGKTIDAIVPPLVFVITQNVWGLLAGIIAAVLCAFLLGFRRAIKKDSMNYAFVGLGGVLFASSLALLGNSAVNYFIPGMITSGLLASICFISVLIKKPFAAYASHLSRAWPLKWFWRPDIRPAYTEVTIFWMVFFSFRLFLQWQLFGADDVTRLGWMNTLLGTPATILVLIVTYIYGIWRLSSLKGPGVEEFLANKTGPWKGQKKGF